MPDSFQVSDVLPAAPRQIYEAWLDAEAHTAMTGGAATVDPSADGKFTAWDGYITGTNLELEPDRWIVQAWRTTQFPEDSPDSRIEVLLEEVDGSTKITLTHSQIPDGQGKSYEQGWSDHYFEPMKNYFSG